jgi:hypothetical protein
MKYLLLPLLFLDCLLNLIVGSHKLNETLSATAARVRASSQPYWGWTANFIDLLALKLFGQTDHCNKQRQGESILGGAWQVWRAE